MKQFIAGLECPGQLTDHVITADNIVDARAEAARRAKLYNKRVQYVVENDENGVFLS